MCVSPRPWRSHQAASTERTEIKTTTSPHLSALEMQTFKQMNMKVLVDREELFVPCTRRVKISLKPGSLLSASRVDTFTFITRLGTSHIFTLMSVCYHGNGSPLFMQEYYYQHAHEFFCILKPALNKSSLLVC